MQFVKKIMDERTYVVKLLVFENVNFKNAENKTVDKYLKV